MLISKTERARKNFSDSTASSLIRVRYLVLCLKGKEREATEVDDRPFGAWREEGGRERRLTNRL